LHIKSYEFADLIALYAGIYPAFFLVYGGRVSKSYFVGFAYSFSALNFHLKMYLTIVNIGKKVIARLFCIKKFVKK